MDNFVLSKKTLAVIENFSNFLNSNKANLKKIRLTPEWFEFKVSGIIGFYNAKDEGNTGFSEIVIGDSKKFLDLVGKMGLAEAQFKDPFLYLKKGDRKIKFHTSIKSSIKPVDRKVQEKFSISYKNNELLIEPFELDLNGLNDFFLDTNMLNYSYMKFESKNNNLKIIGFDSNNIDGGYYEENLNIKVKEKISVILNKEHVNKMFKGNYKVYLLNEMVKFESLDLPGLEYYLSIINV